MHIACTFIDSILSDHWRRERVPGTEQRLLKELLCRLNSLGQGRR